MPVGLIEIRRPTSAEEDDALIAAVHESLVAAFEIPRGDRHHRLVTHDPSRMVRGTGDQVADNYTRITIDCFVGRSINAKRTLYREIITRLATLGIDPLDVSILLRESPLARGSSMYGFRYMGNSCLRALSLVTRIKSGTNSAVPMTIDVGGSWPMFVTGSCFFR